MKYTKENFIRLFKEKIFTHDYTSNNISLTKHYIKLISAGIITAIGLGLDNTSLLVGSLLLSPLIDPLANIILYFFINQPVDYLLTYISYFLTDIVILLCIGYIFGYIFYKLYIKYEEDTDILPEYPTKSMYIHTGTIPIISNIVVCLIAGILLINVYVRNDIFYLIGIAICIAFIIPLVNTGMLLYIGEHHKSKDSFMIFMMGVLSLLFSSIFIPFFSFTYK